MKTYEVKDHAPSLLPDEEWKLVWSDEFDGTELDTSKWGYRLEMMGKRHKTWDTEGVCKAGRQLPCGIYGQRCRQGDSR